MNLNMTRKLFGSRMSFEDHAISENQEGLVTTVYIDRFIPVANIHREYHQRSGQIFYRVLDINGNQILASDQNIDEQKRMLRMWEKEFCISVENGVYAQLPGLRPKRTINRKDRTPGRTQRSFIR